MFLQKTSTKCTILILCAQTIKIAEALVHGDMIVTTEATESGLNGRRVHLPLISSAVKSAWKNALDKGKDAGDAVTDEWTSFKDFWNNSMHIWLFLVIIAVILAFMVCCCCCVPSTLCCTCCPILTNLFTALFKSNNDSKRNDRDWEDHRQTSRQEPIIYRQPIKRRQELIYTDESAEYETDREACYEKDRRRRRPLRNIPMTPVSTPSRSTIRNEKSISSVSSHENSHYSDPNRYTPKAGGQLYPNIP